MVKIGAIAPIFMFQNIKNVNSPKNSHLTEFYKKTQKHTFLLYNLLPLHISSESTPNQLRSENFC